MSGILEKRSSSWFRMKKWYSRLFTLTDHEFSYCDPDKPGQPKKIFPVSRIVLVKPSSKHYLEFEVFFADRQLRLRAPSRQEKLEWVAALRPKTRFAERFPIPLMDNSVRLDVFVAGLDGTPSNPIS